VDARASVVEGHEGSLLRIARRREHHAGERAHQAFEVDVGDAEVRLRELVEDLRRRPPGGEVPPRQRDGDADAADARLTAADLRIGRDARER
jgi:hypothetical protein